jgi:ribosomal protein S18 acetylase RimI-like enzyme
MSDIKIRPLGPSDYQAVIAVINDWWGGRNVRDMIPRLFFTHFTRTSLVAESKGQIAGFLIGFISQSFPDQAYIHFIGIHPGCRKQGLGKDLHRKFYAIVQARGCRSVHCVTSPVNKASIAFHARMGFSIEPGNKIADGIPFTEDYDGPGGDRVLFVKSI